MLMQVATLDILTEKARFEPQVARAIAEAIALESGSSRDNLATKQDLAELRLATKQDLAELRQVTKQDLAELRQVTKQDLTELRQATTQDLGKLREDTKQDVAELRKDITQLRHDVELKMESTKVELVRWVFLAVMGQVALSGGLMYFLLQNVR